MTANTIRNYKNPMRKLWLKIQGDPANATLEMCSKLRYYQQVTGVRAADVRGPGPSIQGGVGHRKSKYSNYLSIRYKSFQRFL